MVWKLIEVWLGTDYENMLRGRAFELENTLKYVKNPGRSIMFAPLNKIKPSDELRFSTQAWLLLKIENAVRVLPNASF